MGECERRLNSRRCEMFPEMGELFGHGYERNNQRGIHKERRKTYIYGNNGENSRVTSVTF